MSTEWIHVRTIDKLPLKRGSNPSPFELFVDGYDPNDSSAFGPDQDTMFLPVQRPAAPEVNPITEQSVNDSTVGVDGTYFGTFVDPNWVVGWNVIPQDLAESKRLKSYALVTARDQKYTDGYQVNGFVFPFSDEFFEELECKRTWMTRAVTTGNITAQTPMTFLDRGEREIGVTAAQLDTQTMAYGLAYFTIKEKYVRAKDRIEAAATVENVDAVTWSF